MRRGLSVIATVSGVVAQLAGLSIDALLHAHDATLAEREGVLTLSNPGHLLFAVGLALSVAGAASLLLPAALFRGRRGGTRMALTALPAVAVVLLAGGAFAFIASTGGLSSHPHPEHANGDHSPADPPAAVAQAAATPETRAHATAPAAAAAAPADVSRHDQGMEVNVSWEQLREFDQMLSQAKAATEKYRDVRVARADGYIQVTQVVPGLGAHFVQPALLASGTFDIEHPAMLLYDRTPGQELELVGVGWYAPKKPGDETPPYPYFGPLGTWHYHTNLCFSARDDSPTVSISTSEGCRAAGGAFVRETGWMMHAWIFRTSPEGVLSHQNSSIRGVGPGIAGR